MVIYYNIIILTNHPGIPGLSRDLVTNPGILSFSVLQMFILDLLIYSYRRFYVQICQNIHVLGKFCLNPVKYSHIKALTFKSRKNLENPGITIVRDW